MALDAAFGQKGGAETIDVPEPGATLPPRVATGGKTHVAGRSMEQIEAARTASGRGNGGRGLGKGGARRHQRKFRDGLAGVTRPDIRRLARRGGIKRISNLIYPDIRNALKAFLDDVVGAAVIHTEFARRKTVTAQDILAGLKNRGITLYGFGNGVSVRMG